MERKDVDLAAGVQKILFPKSSPDCSWGEIGFGNRMAQGVGGDYFDFLTMSDRCQVIFIGDVTGHGLHASLVMALLYGYIHRAFGAPCPCREIVRDLNDFLLSFASRSREFDEFFSCTLFYAVIDPRRGRMSFVNAGHPEPLIRRGGRLLRLPPTAPPLGFFESPEILMKRIDLEGGDRLLLYTDGITDAAEKQELERLLLETGGGPSLLLENLFGNLERPEVEDDCTAIVVDYHGGAREEYSPRDV